MFPDKINSDLYHCLVFMMLIGLLIWFLHIETIVHVSLLKLIRVLSNYIVSFCIFLINIIVNIILAK